MLESQSLPRNGLLVIQSELNSLILSMRRINRWSTSSVNDEYNQLVHSLNEFTDKLLSIDDLNRLGRNEFLNPFLDVIRSEDTNGTATSTALGALNKFLNYSLIDFSSATVSEMIADAVIHAKFVANDQASDGVVFFGMVRVLRNLIFSKGGQNLSNNCVCEIILICIRICFQSRYNEALKRSTETYLKDILYLLFSRFFGFREDEDDQNDTCDVFTVRELFRFLISLCNMKDKEKTEYMIHVGLSLLKVTFEVAADCFHTFPSILSLVKNELCKNLISLLNHERLSIFSQSLQVSYLMFEALRKHLKLQFECFLQKLLAIVKSDSTKISNDERKIALDMIVQIWRTPGMITELYYNYDCNLHTSNLFEDISSLFLTNLSNGVNSNMFQLSLNGINSIIDSIEGHYSLKNPTFSNDVMNASINLNAVAQSSRHKIDKFVPDRSRLSYVKGIKKILPEGIALFNQNAKKGIQFFQENSYLKTDCDSVEIANFLRETPGLDKKVIGEYISSRNNLSILEAYVKTFDFNNLRLDESLRMYLEAFRLPGDSALIRINLEQFADHWHKCNGEPFASTDAAFLLAYSIIMLNVDQHNPNVKKLRPPMVTSDFKKNLHNANGDQVFDEEMLDQIFTSIKNEEIVIPDEQEGIVKENYIWRTLLKKSDSKDGAYSYTENGLFDYDLIMLLWPKLINGLTIVYEKTTDLAISANILRIFEKLANIASYFELSEELDKLIIVVSQYFKLPIPNVQKNYHHVAVYFGDSKKLQMNLKTIFRLVQSHVNLMSNSWRNILDIFRIFFENKLLPDCLIETDDFIEPAGKVSLIKNADEPSNENQPESKFEMSLLSSFYQYMVSDNSSTSPSLEEQKSIKSAKKSIDDCRLEQILNDTKFLQFESLYNLVNILIELSATNTYQIDDNNQLNNDCEVNAFFLELLIKVLIQNRDRILPVWKSIHDHFCSIIVFSSKLNRFLFERSVIGLLKLAIHLMRNEEMSTTVLESLRIFFLVKPNVLLKITKQISFGLYELLKTSAQNIHSNSDWVLIFTMLEFFGAGMHLVQKDADEETIFCLEIESGLQSDEDVQIGDKGYLSDTEVLRSPSSTSRSQSPILKSNSGGWILINHENVSRKDEVVLKKKKIIHHDPYSMSKCCDCLIFLVRDVAHITPYNYQSCLECIRCFVESASFFSVKIVTASHKQKKSSYHDSRIEYYQQISIQLLDLIFTLYTRTAQIFQWWANENSEYTDNISFWNQAWSPLLLAITRFCCDHNSQTRTSAIAYLQRALLFQDMQLMTSLEWEDCFNHVLYPLLSNLLQMHNNHVEIKFLEESRIRAITFVSKIYLHHLNLLSTIDNYHQLWLTLLDFMQKFMYVDNSELLFEAIPECLKNMVLVMNSANLFENRDENSLWFVTWRRIDEFLPNLKNELFSDDKSSNKMYQQSHSQADTIVNIDVSLPISTSSENVELIPQNEDKNTSQTNIILQPPQSEINVTSPLFSFIGESSAKAAENALNRETDIPRNSTEAVTKSSVC